MALVAVIAGNYWLRTRRSRRRGAAVLLFVALTLASAFVGAEPVCSPGNVGVTARTEGEKVILEFHNSESFGVTLTLRADLANMASDPGLPLVKSFPGNSAEKLATLTVAKPGQPWNYSYRYHWERGVREVEHDNSVMYELPWSPGVSFPVIQGYGGWFSHRGNFYHSIDWDMPEGTMVCAARGGTVVAARGDSSTTGPEQRYANCANFVIVRHDDGTYGEYDHFRRDGLKVVVGQAVKTGDALGESGNTGFSAGPHLHFTVYRGVDGDTRQTFAVRFRVAERGALDRFLGRGTTLKKGRSYIRPAE